MRSKVSFGLGAQNKGVVKMNVIHSEDVRDHIACDFLEGFGHESNLAKVVFLPSESGGCTMQIYPVCPTQEHCDDLISNSSPMMCSMLRKALDNTKPLMQKPEE